MIVARDHMLGTQVQINYKLKALILVEETSITATYPMSKNGRAIQNEYYARKSQGEITRY